MKKFICHARGSGHPCRVFWIAAFAAMTVFTADCGLRTVDSSADTIYMKDQVTEKGLVVEEYCDRFVFNTEEGEREIPKSSIDEVFFDESFQNNVYLGKKFEKAKDFNSALRFYRLALRDNPDYREADYAVRGLDDAKWRAEKTLSYRELREMVKAQLGIGLAVNKGRIIIKTKYSSEPEMFAGDALIYCWAEPLTYAGLKNASKVLGGLPNTMLQLIVERDMRAGPIYGFGFLPPIQIGMEWEGPVIKNIKQKSDTYRSGLRAGDLIVKIDGVSTRYMKLAELNRRIFNKIKPKVFTVRRVVKLMRKKTESVNTTKNGMWVWHSKEVLLNDARKKELLDFCREKNIGLIFFQLQYQFIPYKGETICRLFYEAKLKAFLKDAHLAQVKVHCLDGSPSFCLEGGHHLVLAQLEAILDFNSKNEAAERFDGIHYDNEPYMLPGFNSNLRDDILRQYLLLNEKCRKFISAKGVKIDFGVDIPFWFGDFNQLDHKLLEVCDNVGIMDYRNFAQGPDGIIAHAADLLKYASAVGKKVFVGIETSRYPRQEVYFVSVLAQDEFNRRLAQEQASAVRDGNLFDGFGVIAHAYNNNVYLGLIRPERANEGDFTRALSKAGNLFGRIPKPDGKEALDNLSMDIMSAISKNEELRDIQFQDYPGEDGKVCLLFKARNEILEKLTFADTAENDLNSVLSESKSAFEAYPAFAGFAIHHYKSYKEICEKK